MKPRGKGWVSVEKALPPENKHVTIWVDIYASPRSMGMSDSSPEPDCWLSGGRWVHVYKDKIAEIYHDYVTHWKKE